MANGRMQMNKQRLPSPRKQRGIATLLIVLMVGLAVSVTVAATVYSLRGAQSHQLTTHSATAAQAAAWRGVEALRLYLLQVEKTVWPGWVGDSLKPVTGLGAIGVRKAEVTRIEAIGSNQYRVNARVTGAAGVGSALTTATVEVTYDVVPGSGTPGTPPVCHSTPNAPVVFNGDVTLGGGGTEIVDDKYDYEHVLIAGDLNVGGSEVKVSGCVKGDVKVTGGGLTKDGHLNSEKSITLGGMTFPAGAKLWAKDIYLNGGSAGPIGELKVGAYDALVYVGDIEIGDAKVGGALLPGTVTGSIPWTTGTVLPSVPGKVKITLKAGKGTVEEVVFLLNMAAPGLSVNAASGEVSGLDGAIEQVAGPPSSAFQGKSLSFKSTSIFGGTFTQGSGATTNITDVWGWNVSLGSDSRQYERVRAGAQLAVQYKNVVVRDFVGGGSVWSQSGQYGGKNVSGFPTVSGKVAGNRYYGSDRSLLPADAVVSGFNVQASASGTSPGLPGLPYCDIRTRHIDADTYKSMANYVFESVNGAAQLTIQNVKRASGVSIDGVYPLKNPQADKLALLQELMVCNNGNDRGCLNVHKSDGSWQLNAVGKMPPGVLWFDAALTVSGTSVDLRNTIINRGGDVALTSSGHRDLVAPNFAGASAVCGGDFYPTNLCASRSEFVSWKDAADQTRVGLPIGNTALITEQGLRVDGWKIFGAVMLGRSIAVAGAKVVIEGSLSVGNNEFSAVNVGASGIKVETPKDWNNLGQLPVCSAGSGALPFTPASASVLWSRYL